MQLKVRAAVILATLVLACLPLASAGAQSTDAPPSGAVLAPAGRQVAWLSLEAPRPRFVTHFDAPDYVSDVAVPTGANRAAAVVVHLPTVGSVPYGDIMLVDLTSSTASPLVGDPDATESLSAPVWSSDGTRLFFQREDISVVGTSYAGGATVQYPSRLEQVNADGSGRTIVVGNGRQPASSPDGQDIAYVYRTEQGPALVIRNLTDATERTVLAAGQFGDIMTPRYSPRGDRIAFMAPVGLAPVSARGVFFNVAWFAAPLRLAHGTPWDVWIVNADGSAPASRLAAVSADDGTLAWSPDGSRLFVYGGTGSFIVDVANGEVMPLSFLSGYGSTSWVSD
jgi:Tol biopolymer transport system component